MYYRPHIFIFKEDFNMLGSWNINVVVDGMPEKVATAVSKLNEQLLGAEYTPIAYLGSQVVNGTNHAVLAEQLLITGRDTKNIVLIIFNEKPSSGIEDLTLVAIERVVEGGEGMGAVEVNVKTDIPVDAKVAFASVIGDFVGSDVEPFALLATQVVNGVDYIFAAEVTSVTAAPVKKVCKVTVNELNKTVSFVDILK
jgi:hypothetical protein